MNFYGFKKIPNPWKTIYYHKFFKRGKPGLLEHIQRRQNPKRNCQKNKTGNGKRKMIIKKQKNKKKKVLMNVNLNLDPLSDYYIDEEIKLKELGNDINQLKFKLSGLEKRIYTQIIESNQLIQEQSFMMSQIFKMRKENEDRLDGLWKIIMEVIEQMKSGKSNFLEKFELNPATLNVPAISYKPHYRDNMLIKNKNDDPVDYSLSKLETIQSATISKDLKKNEVNNFGDVDQKYHDLLDDFKEKDLTLSQEQSLDYNKNSIIAKKAQDAISVDTNQENKSIYDKIPKDSSKIISEIPPPLSQNNQLAIIPSIVKKPNMVGLKKRKFTSSLFDNKGVVKGTSIQTKQNEQRNPFQTNLSGIQNLGMKSNQNVDLILGEIFKMFQKQNIQFDHQHFVRNLIEKGLSFYLGIVYKFFD